MKTPMKALVALALVGAGVTSFSPQPAQALIGPLIEGFMVTQIGSFYRMSIPDGGTSGGISHDLDPSDWYRWRVKVSHDDSLFPYFVSDSFAPTSNDIQLCGSNGCEAPAIELGLENLDWDDTDKITFVLEAKECLLCSWTPFEMTLEE